MTSRFSIGFLVLALLAGCAAPAPGAPPSVAAGADPEAWRTVPAGEFLMGLHDKPARIDADYEMMVTPVTNAQYARYLVEALAAGTVRVVDGQVLGHYDGDVFHGAKREERIDPGEYPHVPLNDPGTHILLADDGRSASANPGYADHPMVMVTWFGAHAYCTYYGWRLPTDPEWEKAARGTDGRPFPWGDDVERNRANFYNSRDLFEGLADRGADTTPVGFYNGQTVHGYATLDNASPYGLYDMAGNVWQWTGSIYEGMHYRSLRGGSKDTYGYNLRIYTINNATPTYASPGVGFRCAR